MSKRIAFDGAGALGGYLGGCLAHHGHDATLVDMWPEHIEAIRARGLELDGVTPEEKLTVTKAKTMHLTEVQRLAKEQPIDIAFISVKSFATPAHVKLTEVVTRLERGELPQSPANLGG